MVVGTFTPEVSSSFEYLRNAINDVDDGGLRQTLTAIVDGLVLNLENQMLLVFANCAVREHERELLLKKGQEDVGLLDYYESSLRTLQERGMSGSSPLGDPTVTGAQMKKSAKANTTSLSDDAALRAAAPDVEVAKQLLIMFHGAVQALAHNTHAERVVLHLHQKATGSLKVLCSIPDHSVAVKAATTPSHQGVIGNCFSTGLAVRVDNIDAEKRKTMYVHSPDIHSVLAFPILEPIHNHTVGVVELLNKANGAAWSQMDEAHAFHTCLLLQYFFYTFGSRIDFFSAPIFNPTQLNMVHAYQPGQLSGDLAKLPGGNSGAFIKAQLVARVQHAEQFPAKATGKQHNLYAVEQLANVRELSEYLDLLDFNMRANINELVAAKQREQEYKDNIQKLNIRVKVQEENAQHLQDQLNDAKRVILAQKISAGEQTGRGFDGMMTHRTGGMTTRQSLTQRSLQKVPLTAQSKEGKEKDSHRSHSQQSKADSSFNSSLPPVREALRPSTLHEFLVSASAELEKLQKKALGQSTAMQRHRMLTPQPTTTSLFNKSLTHHHN